MEAELNQMRACLVEPYLFSVFLRRDLSKPLLGEYVDRWALAEDDENKLFYEPSDNLFYLAGKSTEHGWTTFGVYGDPVGTFIAR